MHCGVTLLSDHTYLARYPSASSALSGRRQRIVSFSDRPWKQDSLPCMLTHTTTQQLLPLVRYYIVPWCSQAFPSPSNTRESFLPHSHSLFPLPSFLLPFTPFPFFFLHITRPPSSSLFLLFSLFLSSSYHPPTPLSSLPMCALTCIGTSLLRELKKIDDKALLVEVSLCSPNQDIFHVAIFVSLMPSYHPETFVQYSSFITLIPGSTAGKQSLP